ncbi:Ig-like domain-containing protein [Cryobacterium serini]|uniref:Ig-like domain repeat protein n=1 Tax=Cryobacterium serini TaxID=1259201 RepID=A0A4R9BQS9_9MICO|nr:Ig-like domain-containing protein [Cryobacterium serini]TFD89066.1 Ig-like domain repeat protein [Cryobacterium serini]
MAPSSHPSNSTRLGARRLWHLPALVMPTVVVLGALIGVPAASAATDVSAISTGRGTVSIVAGTYDFFFAGQRASVYGEISAVAPTTGVPTGTVRVVSLEPGSPTDTQELLPSDTVGVFYSDAQPSVAGTRQFRVDYLGDANFAPASKTFDYVVPIGPDTKTTLIAKPSGTITAGQSITFTADVTDSKGRALGTPLFGEEISFFDNGQPLVGDQVFGEWHSTLTTTSLSVGVHRITAKSFAVFYDSSTSPVVTVTVLAKTAAAAKVAGTLSVSPRGEVNVGTAVRAVAKFTPRSGTATVTGFVQFYDITTKVGSRVALKNGSASFTYTSLKVGTHALIARYLGTPKFAQTLTVPKIVRVIR